VFNPSKAEVKAEPDDKVVSFVEMASVNNDGYIETKVDKPLGELRSSSYTNFREDDIIIAKITPCMENGKCGIAEGLSNGIGMGSSEFHVLRCGERITNRFLFLLLNRDAIRKAAASQMTGSSGHRRVPISFYENMQIPIPPLDIQRKIMVECETVDQECAHNRNAIRYSRGKAGTLINSVFGKYEMHPLERVCDSFEYGTSAKSSTTGDVAVVRMGNLQDGQIVWNDVVYTSDKTEIGKYLLKKNDVLFNRTNSPIWVGKTGLYTGDRPAIFAGYLIRVNYKHDMLNPKFLTYVLNSDKMRKHGFSVMSKAINQANISAGLLKKYQIPVPPLAEQNRIASELEGYEAEIAAARAVLAAAPARKQAILEKWL
jgi:restriction endonuclease S subunit